MKKLTLLIFTILTALVFVHSASAAGIHSAGKKQVMLTIDDGPKEEYTDEMLAVLKDKGVKAMFFLLGKDVQKRPDDVKKIADAGHVIANHSYSHDSLKGMSYDNIIAELQRCNDLLEEITGKRPRYMRPPHGDYNDTVLKACAVLDLTVVFWTNNPGDYKMEPAKTIADRVIRNKADGDIILVHLGLLNTVEALPRIIDAYRKAGFKFVLPPD